MASTEGIPSPVRELRDSFGDRKLPDISRKIVACVACRKMKIKCHMKDSQPPCTRCKKRGLSCTVNRSLQMLLEDSATWKDTMGRKVHLLENAIAQVAEKLSMPELLSLVPDSQQRTPVESEMGIESGLQKPSPPAALAQTHPQSTWEVVMDPESDIPASCVTEVASISQRDSGGPAGEHRATADLVSRGIISNDTAQALFSVYSRLDQYLYGILGDHDNLASVRGSSALLTSAICAVGALHSASIGALGSAFDKCYQDFIDLSAACALSKRNTMDEVRGLVIGAFWLSDLSWTLVGAAVRIATEIGLHRSLALALQGDRDSYLKYRLYLHVHVCDHHFSVAYGRPPMTRCHTIRNALRLLECEHATENDARLISQVKIWDISCQIHQMFDSDFNAPVSDVQMPQLRRLSIALDSWRADWNERFSVNRHVGNYPKKGVGLHYHFAKLYLCSHAFRGALKAGKTVHDMSSDIEEFANIAVLSARSILRVLVSDPEMQSCLDGLPSYFDTMIAFAVVFLLKIATMYSGTIRTDRDEIFATIDQVVAVFEDITSRMHRQHILVSIAAGVQKLLDRCRKPQQTSTVANHPTGGYPIPNILPQEDIFTGGQDWMISPSDSFILGNFDFLGQQDMMNGFDFNLVNLELQQVPPP